MDFDIEDHRCTSQSQPVCPFRIVNVSAFPQLKLCVFIIMTSLVMMYEFLNFSMSSSAFDYVNHVEVLALLKAIFCSFGSTQVLTPEFPGLTTHSYRTPRHSPQQLHHLLPRPPSNQAGKLPESPYHQRSCE